jgi:hypothetical protein
MHAFMMELHETYYACENYMGFMYVQLHGVYHACESNALCKLEVLIQA